MNAPPPHSLVGYALGAMACRPAWRYGPHIIEAVLNHISGHKAGVAGIYNRATYLPEKTDALNRWAAHLVAVVTA
jgi:hypothetical protein